MMFVYLLVSLGLASTPAVQDDVPSSSTSRSVAQLLRGKKWTISQETVPLSTLLIQRGIATLSPGEDTHTDEIRSLAEPTLSTLDMAVRYKSKVGIAVYQMPEEADAQAVIALRRALARDQVKNGNRHQVRDDGSTGYTDARVRSFGAGRRVPSVDDAMVFAIGTGNDGTVEYWIASDNVVVVALANQHALGAGQVARAMEEVLQSQ